MEDDFASRLRRGAIIDMRSVEEMPGLIIPTRPEQWVVVDSTGRELIEQRMVVQADGHRFILAMVCEPFDHQRIRVIHKYVRELESRPEDHGYFRGRILERKLTIGSDGQPETWLLVEFPGGGASAGDVGPHRRWHLERDMPFLEERPDPPAADIDDSPGGAKARGVLAAIGALWPDGIIPIVGKERDNAVRTWLIAHGHSVPVNIARAVQRALATAEEAQQGPRR